MPVGTYGAWGNGEDVTAAQMNQIIADILAHLADTVDSHDATAVSFAPTGTVAATTAQAAIAEVAVDSVQTSTKGVANGVASLDGTAKIPSAQLPVITTTAASVSFSPTGTIASTNTQAAVAEASADLTTHLNDPGPAHPASAVGFTPVGAITATNVQNAIVQASAGGGGGAGAGALFNVKDYGATGNGSTSDKQAFVDARAAAIAAGGGVVYMPTGVYNLVDLNFVLPTATMFTTGSGSVNLLGDGKANTFLTWSTDRGLDTYAISCGAETATQVGGTGRFSQSFYEGWCEGFTMVGPGNGGSALGTSPCNMSGFAWGARRTMRDVGIRAFRKGCSIVGDHTLFIDCKFTNNFFNLYYEVRNGLHGDLVFIRCIFELGRMAAIGMGPHGQIIGSTFIGCFLGVAPYSIFREAGTVSTNFEMIIDCRFENIMCEAVGNAVLFEDNATRVSTAVRFEWDHCYFSWSDGNKIAARARIGLMHLNTVSRFQMRDPKVPGSGLSSGTGGVATFNVNNYDGWVLEGAISTYISQSASMGTPILTGNSFQWGQVRLIEPGHWEGYFMNTTDAIAVNNVVERTTGNNVRRGTATTANPAIGICKGTTAIGDPCPIATAGRRQTVSTTGTLAATLVKKGATGTIVAAAAESDLGFIGWQNVAASGTSEVHLMLPG